MVVGIEIRWYLQIRHKDPEDRLIMFPGISIPGHSNVQKRCASFVAIVFQSKGAAVLLTPDFNPMVATVLLTSYFISIVAMVLFPGIEITGNF